MKYRTICLLITLTWIPLHLLNANILTVPGNYPTIQAAMDSAVDGDTILVAQGTYYENVNFRGKGVVLASYYLINNDTSYISNTIINGSTPVHPDTASCVIMARPTITSAGDTSAALIGFTLTQGIGTVWEDVHYPGYWFREGGGILIQYWAPRIRFNRILENHTDNDIQHPNGGGGAIRCGDGNPLIENNVILNNSAYVGTAICLYFSSGTIRNNIIAGNYGGRIYGGGAIYTYQNLSYPILIENNTLVSNSANVGYCGGLRLYLSNNVTVINNIIWANYPSQILQSGGTVSITYCDVQDGWSGNGNINDDPQFLDNSYYLNSTSPCKDAGDSSLVYNDPEDPSNPGTALWPALGTLRNDMGAFGGPHCAVIGSVIVGVKDNELITKIGDFGLEQNYPNPFNPSTKISYQISVQGFVSLKVYDVLGNEVATLVSKEKTAGEYKVDFNAATLPSGIYFYQLKSKDVTLTKKMILMR